MARRAEIDPRPSVLCGQPSSTAARELRLDGAAAGPAQPDLCGGHPSSAARGGGHDAAGHELRPHAEAALAELRAGAKAATIWASGAASSSSGRVWRSGRSRWGRGAPGGDVLPPPCRWWCSIWWQQSRFGDEVSTTPSSHLLQVGSSSGRRKGSPAPGRIPGSGRPRWEGPAMGKKAEAGWPGRRGQVVEGGRNGSNSGVGAPFSTRRRRGWRGESRGWIVIEAGIRTLLECVFCSEPYFFSRGAQVGALLELLLAD
jgi:hypothetical protein